MTPPLLCLRPEAHFARVDALPPAGLAVSYHKPDDAAVPRLMKEARALVVPAVGPKLPAALFEGCGLALVQVTGAGLDRLDQAALTRLGIPVANVPGGSNGAVAEYAVTSASLLLRRLGWASAEIAKGNYAAFRARMVADNLAGLDGLLVGVIGFGTIGVAVARAFRAAGCRICFHDPALRDQAAALALGAAAMTLDQLLAAADVVTLHLPLLPETQELLGARQLARMKKGAILVQAARGGIVDEAALADSLAAGHLSGAAVDVYSVEPPASDNPLLRLAAEATEAASRLLLTPHMAGAGRATSALPFCSPRQNGG